MINKTVWLLATFAFFLFGCPTPPDKTLIAEYPLSDTIASLVPYQPQEKIIFLSDSGQRLVFKVQRKREWVEKNLYDNCGLAPARNIEYIRYEYDQTNLVSSYPAVNIEITLYPKGLYYDSLAVMHVKINTIYSWQLLYDTDFVENENTTLYDSIIFWGNTFHHVVESEISNTWLDSSAVYFDKIFYNKTWGIINLKMTDNEEFILDR